MVGIQWHATGFTLWLFRDRISFGFFVYLNHFGHVPFVEIRANGGRYADECMDINWRIFWVITGSITLWQIGRFERVLRYWKRDGA